MDRLTNVIQDGPISVLTLKRAEVGNVTVWREWSQCQDPDIEAALHRLAKYENSGLTPERAQEIGKADADGRVVVLPCKVGDTVYRIFCGKVIESTIDMIYVNRFTNPQIWVELGCRFMCSQTERWDLVAGKEIFNDRESAEDALAKMKEKNNRQA